MAEPKPKVLIIDDGLHYAQVVSEQLTDLELVAPYGPAEPRRIADGPTALAYLRRHAEQIDVVLLDMKFDLEAERLLPLGPDQSLSRTRRFQGVAILRELRRRHPDLPVVLATAVEDLSLIDVEAELAAQSMTFVLDGDDLDTLRIRIHAALQESRRDAEDGPVLWGQDRRARAARRRLEVLARGTFPVLLEGETGTGKSFIAEHFLHSQSGRSGPFVTLDLSAVPRDLVPAHLFGAARGAYTGAVADRKGAFELAHGGTLFIDEVQNIPLEVQKQLLVVLQDRRLRPLGSSQEMQVDVKVIAATNQPLAEAVAQGRVRQDLSMRLGPATRVTLPPLRERAGDLPFLTQRLFARAAEDPDSARLLAEVAAALGLPRRAPLEVVLGRAKGGSTPHSLQLVLPPPVWQRLKQHPWPGNVRELSMVCANILGFTLVEALQAARAGTPLSSPRLQVDAGLIGQLLATAPLEPRAAAQADGEGSVQVQVRPGETLNAVANEVERQYLRALFSRHAGDFSAMAATLLGDAGRARAVRLRFNQIGLKVRELRQP